METASCRICNKRKIKCDRTPGACHKCRKFGEHCVYPTHTATGDINDGSTPRGFITQAGLKRRRILRSCVECKRAKAKCSGGPRCTRCAKKTLDCFYYSTVTGFLEKPASRISSYSIPPWLASGNLPPLDQIRELVDIYFARIHTLRCMGFLHIPSFMERFMDSEKIYTEESGLIYIMCALAAPFYYAQIIGTNAEELNSSIRFFNAGKGWADTAMQYVFSSFGNPGIESLITQVLLHEYYLRIGDHAKGFLISGLIARHVQVLQLNIEYDYDVLCQKSKITWAIKESRRRLVWTCYVLDAFIECGIDQLRFISSDDMQVQLPCSEDMFVRNIPCITEMLPRGKLLPFVDPPLGNDATGNLDMRAFYVRAMVIRSKILRYVKHLEGEVPWASNEDAQFHRLNDELRDLEDSIPDTLKISSENTYLFKASGRLNLYFGLHILISQNYNDLYRIVVSQLVFPNTATKWIRENAPKEFIKLGHQMCVSKALYIASLLKDLWQCHKPSIIDIPFAVHTHICSSVLVTSLVSWAESEPLLPQLSHQACQEILQNNVRILQYIQKYIKADLYYESASQALKQFNKLFFQEETERSTNSMIEVSTNDRADNPPQFSLEYILNPLGTYPMARKQAYDRHKPEFSGTEELAASELVDHRNPGPPSTEVANIDSFLNLDDISPSYIFNWESEIPIIDSMGYPIFLE